ncbi:hypothetical protein GCM10009425_17060 [Pseudomonas asuensis]|uniref:Serine kinase/phosphatase n=1 Tax=Pseudomonas asuensis TaxID=1825787 RepID=A0ABQ2GQP8_9PSED|nr:hypothetical protein [Pseudomonas asuensis]GGM06395.1 hypothetical protein GCM10009425_17060 [Pseudomonas asuensis]
MHPIESDIPEVRAAPVYLSEKDDGASIENVPGGSYDVDEDFIESVGDESQMDDSEEEN